MSAKEILNRYLVEINKHDFKLVSPFISKDCKFWFSSGTYEGLDQVSNAFEKTWRMIREEVYSVSDECWIAVSDEAAVCTYTFHWRGLIEGAMREGSGRGTSCLRKESDGWKIVHEHLSHFPN